MTQSKGIGKIVEMICDPVFLILRAMCSVRNDKLGCMEAAGPQQHYSQLKTLQNQ